MGDPRCYVTPLAENEDEGFSTSILGATVDINGSYDGEGLTGWGAESGLEAHGYEMAIEKTLYENQNGIVITPGFKIEFLKAQAGVALELGRDNQWGATGEANAFLLGGEANATLEFDSELGYLGAAQGYLIGIGGAGGAMFDLDTTDGKNPFENFVPKKAKGKLLIGPYGGGFNLEKLDAGDLRCD